MAGLVPAIHAFRFRSLRECAAARGPKRAKRQPNRMDGRDKPGHDEARKVSGGDEDGR